MKGFQRFQLQIEANRKREGELQKLRKLLEESQLESEDAMNVLRKKHQDACLDYTEQIEQLHKKNSKYETSIEMTHNVLTLRIQKALKLVEKPLKFLDLYEAILDFNSAHFLLLHSGKRHIADGGEVHRNMKDAERGLKKKQILQKWTGSAEHRETMNAIVEELALL